MTDIDKLVRDNIRSLAPYSSARDEFSGDEGIFLDANENPYGDLNRYPDPYQKVLKREIGRIKNTDPENIFLGNGSDEIIDLLIRLFCRPGKDKALTFSPTYGMYEVSAAVNDIEILKLPLTDDFQIDTDRIKEYISADDIKIIFICSPNNPTGNTVNTSDIEFIMSVFKGIIVIDEAYIDFSDKLSFLKKIEGNNRLVVMQTFSKAWGMAGVRIGMAFAEKKLISYLNRIKPPYNISVVNQKAVLERISDQSSFLSEVNKIKAERERLISELKHMKIVEHIFPTDANFVLVRVNDADNVYNTLVQKKIIVRNRSRVVSGCLRITVGTVEENDVLIKALREI